MKKKLKVDSHDEDESPVKVKSKPAPKTEKKKHTLGDFFLLPHLHKPKAKK